MVIAANPRVKEFVVARLPHSRVKPFLEKERLVRFFVLYFTLVIAIVHHMPAARGQDFGDHASVTLTGKAWAALAEGNHEHVTAYVDKCCELYAAEAAKQQGQLKDFASGNEAIHANWALNDVGTCLFIQGESYMQQGKAKQAIESYQKLVDSYGFCQCWDTKGWFWKPAEAAAGKIKELEFEAVLDE